MHLSNAQLQSLKAAINADPTMAAFPLTADGYVDLATYLNKPSTPDFFVFKTLVSWNAIGDKVNAGELVGLTTGKLTQLQVFIQLSPQGINPSVVDRRDALDQIFSAAGGAITRPALAILWRTLATRFQKILATGAGTSGSPATLGSDADGNLLTTINAAHVQEARGLA